MNFQVRKVNPVHIYDARLKPVIDRRRVVLRPTVGRTFDVEEEALLQEVVSHLLDHFDFRSNEFQIDFMVSSSRTLARKTNEEIKMEIESLAVSENMSLKDFSISFEESK